MRRKDLAVTDPKQIDEIIQSCESLRLAFADGKRPYILPLSFGYRREGDTPVFYFHGAAAGRKVDLVRALGYGAVQLDTDQKVNPDDKACDFSVRYQSVFAEGDLTEITDVSGKTEALMVIMKHYSEKESWEFPPAVLEKTFVFRMTVKELSAKMHG